MTKLKVLQIIPNFGVGGAEKLVLDYLININPKNVEIMALSLFSETGSIYDQKINSYNLNVKYLDKKLGLDLTIIKKIKNVISEFKPDIVHSHLYTTKYILPSAISYKFKWFHTIHNEPEKDAIGIDKKLNRIAFKLFKCTPIALSNDLAEKVKKYYNLSMDVHVLNNGINIEKYKKIETNKLNMREKLELPKRAFIVGHVGRFSHQKNHTFIIDIFSTFLKRNSNAYLILIGDGELKSHIEKIVQDKKIEKNVKFLGIRDDIPELIKCMDVFLFPSLHEGFPLTLIEAQATGVKCVVSNTIDRIAILSEKTISIDLAKSTEIWCDIIESEDVKNPNFGDIDEYNIKNIVGKLQKMYQDKMLN